MPVNLAIGDTVLLKGKITAVDSKGVSVYIKNAKTLTTPADSSLDGGVGLELESADISHEPVIIIVD